ncbi:hypothetical protein SCAR479_08196 [Seiridium cardinale]|uniref:Uncharacterized protein n=1 Tax=Seiridium cardinale TaxID=138064 RepID=A0ABR2XNI3_9PEZI
MASTSQVAASTLAATATTFIQVFETLDTSKLVPIQAENYSHEFAPASMGMPHLKSGEAFNSHLGSLTRVMRGFPGQIKQIWPNPSLNQCTVWANAVADFHDHVKDSDSEEEWKYRGEYIFVFKMDQSGKKIEHVLEFVDSQGTEKLRGLITRALKKLDKLEAEKGRK